MAASSLLKPRWQIARADNTGMSLRLPVLIFDGDCGFCTQSARLVGRMDQHHVITVLPWQTAGLLAATGLSEAQVNEAAWYVDNQGNRHRGAAAVNAALAALGGIYRLLSRLYRVPGLRQLEDAVYAWVARNRHRLPGSTDACERPA